MKSLTAVLKENLANTYLIHRMAMYELKKKYSSTALGNIWVLLNPAIQIAIYYLVFGIGIRGNSSVDGHPFFVWMVVGIVPWLYTSQALIRGANSIHSYLNTVSRMNFPLSVVPTAVLVSNLYAHIVTVGILLVFSFIYVGFSWKIFLVVYFILALSLILWVSTYLLSTLSTISRDFQLFFQSAIRMLFYLTPILWVPSAGSWFADILKLNPFYYIVEGFRATLLDGDISILWSWQTPYFWGIVALLLFYGSYLHVKFRRFFIDYM
ncbi:MAG: ABC transporter permease [Bacilli bacterium]